MSSPFQSNAFQTGAFQTGVPFYDVIGAEHMFQTRLWFTQTEEYSYASGPGILDIATTYTEARGAYGYRVFIVELFDGTATITHLGEAGTFRAATRLTRVTSTNRAVEVWQIPVNYSNFQIGYQAYLSKPTAVIAQQFVVYGVDSLSAFGTVTSNSGTAKHSQLLVAGELDSYILEVFASTGAVSVAAGPEQTVLKSVTQGQGMSLTATMKEAFTDTINVVRSTQSASAEFIHLAFTINSIGRRNAAFTAFLEAPAQERTILAEVSAAVNDPWGWTAMTASPADYQSNASASSATVSGVIVNSGESNQAMLVTVASKYAAWSGSPVQRGASSVVYAGSKNLTYITGSSVVNGAGVLCVLELWVATGTFSNTGSVVVTLQSGFTIHSTYVSVVRNVNQTFPIKNVKVVSGTHVGTLWITPTGSSSYGPSVGFTGAKDEMHYDAIFGDVSDFDSRTGWWIGSTDPLGGSQIESQTGTNPAGIHHISYMKYVTGGEAAGWSIDGTWYAFLRVALVPAVTSRVYTYPFMAVVTGGRDRSGMQRAFESIEVTGTALLKHASLASLVAADPGVGGFYYDLATNTAYLRTPSLLDTVPSTFASVTLEFSLLVSNRLADFIGGDYYDPRLTGVFPSVQAEQPKMLFGTVAYPSGTLDIDNSDGFFDSYVNDWYWKNRQVRVYYGGPALTRAEYRQAFTMLIDDPQCSYEYLTLRLRALGNSLQANVLQQTIGTYIFGENVPDPESFSQVEISGSPAGWYDFTGIELSAMLPYRLGALKGIPALFVQKYMPPNVTTFLRHNYLVDSNPSKEYTNVRLVSRLDGSIVSLAKYDPLTPLPAAQYVVLPDFLNVLSVVVEGFDPELYDVVVDAASDSRIYAGAAIRTLLLLGGVNPSEIDAKSFEEFDTLYPTEVGFYITEQTTVLQVLDLIQKSAHVALNYTQDGTWSILKWLPTVRNFENLPSLSQSNFKTLPHPVLRPQTPFFEIIVQYNYQPYYGFYSEVSRSALATIGTHKTIESYYVRTCLMSSDDADLTADRIRALQLSHPLTFEVELNGMDLFDNNVYDRFRLSLDRAPGSASGWDNEVVQIVSIEKTLNPDGITITLDNMHGIGARMKLAAPDYYNTVMKHAPYAYWRFEEPIGYPLMLNEVDITKYRLTPAGGYTLRQSSVLEENDRYAIAFNGTSGVLTNTTDASLLNDTEAITFEAWIKGDSIAWATAGGHENFVNSSAQGNYLSVMNGHPFMSLRIAGTLRTLDSNVTIDTFSWYHIVGTWKSGDPLRIYINGELAATGGTAYTGTISDSTGGISIGAFNPASPSSFFGGTVDEVAIYPVQLTDDEIGEHYAARLYGRSWDEVSSLEKMKYAFVADNTTGRVDVNDPATKGQAIAW